MQIIETLTASEVINPQPEPERADAVTDTESAASVAAMPVRGCAEEEMPTGQHGEADGLLARGDSAPVCQPQERSEVNVNASATMLVPTETAMPAGSTNAGPSDTPIDGAESNPADGISSENDAERRTEAGDAIAGPQPSETLDEAPTPSLPDPATISARLKNLVLSVSQVEELSRHAREVAATDLAKYEGLNASQRQFDDGLAEARRIHQEAQAVYQRAFGRDARAVAEPALVEADEVEQAFAELAEAWRQQAESFLAEHPDVEALLAEQHEQHEETRRREAARARAGRFQELVAATDAAIRDGQVDAARDFLRLLGREFPNEADRLVPIQERLDRRARAANDAAARQILLQASELLGRGDLEGAVKCFESVDVPGLSREVSEDVFGRWSAACSLLGQTGGLELLRYSPSQGRGIILQRDPSVPYGLVVFSSLGMGQSYFEGRVVSKADREGSAIVARARPFRAAEPLAELSAGWYGRSYVTPAASGGLVRH